MNKSFVLFFLLIAALLVCCVLTLTTGETPWDIVWQETIERLQGRSTKWNPLLDERLPRLIVVLCTGASLAVSGAVMQSLFQNPLASPSVLGISSGGNLLAILVFIFDLTLHYPFALPLAAVSGCFLTLCFVYAISRCQAGLHLYNLILTGIAVSTILIAIHSLLLYALRDQWQLIQTITEWEAGSTLDRHWQHAHMQLPLTVVGVSGCWIYRREMNILALGDEEALNLGVNVKTIRWRLFLCVSLLTGGVLAAIGVIAFFGLILPHLIRYIHGSNYATLIPLCVALGATTLLGLDLTLRFFSIHALSIGNFSALVGGFCFMILLFRTQQHRQVA